MDGLGNRSSIHLRYRGTRAVYRIVYPAAENNDNCAFPPFRRGSISLHLLELRIKLLYIGGRYGHASIDVWLERNDLLIACEVSFTNTEDNESSKIIKCLKAEIPTFALICVDEKKLQKIAAEISGNLITELASRVQYFQSNPFIKYLNTLRSSAPAVAHPPFSENVVQLEPAAKG
jgi:hypothetical protein